MVIVEQRSVHWQDLPEDNNFATYDWDNQFGLVLGDEMRFDSDDVVVTGLKIHKIIIFKLFRILFQVFSFCYLVIDFYLQCMVARL